MKKGIITVCALIISSLVTAETDVFVITGQSNSVGYIKDGESLSLASDRVDKRIKFFWVNRDPRANIISSSKGKIDRMQVQMCDVNSKDGNWGLEMVCSRDLYKSGMKNLMFIKVGRGGGGSKFWLKGSSDDHMYKAVVENVKVATAELRKKKIKYRIRGLLYLQGESDGVDSPLAGERAKLLLTNLRKDLPRAKKMKMFIGEISGFSSQQNITRKLHKELAENDSDFLFITTEDLRNKSLYRDRLHFNNVAKLEIGKRFADTIKKVLK